MRDEQIAPLSERDMYVRRLCILIDELQLKRRELWRAKDSTNDVAYQRLRTRILDLSLDVRTTQLEADEHGHTIYVSYDGNGLPIRVREKCHVDIVS